MGPPLAEWMLQVKDKLRERGQGVEERDQGVPENGLFHHVEAIERSLSAFKVVDKYSEASMWGKLVPIA